MIAKTDSISPVIVRKGKYGYNIWIYEETTYHTNGGSRHHYKMMNRYSSYVSYDDAYDDGWKYINYGVKRLDDK
jgi:hypothetical protein